MLSTNPDLELLPDLPAFLYTHPHELADTFAIQRLKGIEGQDSPVYEIQEELAFRVVTGISECGLREIVRPEGEELRVLRDLVRRERCPRELDHRPEFIRYGDALPFHDLLRFCLERVSLDLQLVHVTRQGDHDLRLYNDAFFGERAGGLEDCPDLHLRDLGEGDPEAASSKTQHRVRFPVRSDGFEKDLLPRQKRLDSTANIPVPRFRDLLDEFLIFVGMSAVDEHLRIAPCQSELCHLDEQALVLWKELMERRIDQADDHGKSLHGPEDADEILLLEATEFL